MHNMLVDNLIENWKLLEIIFILKNVDFISVLFL